MDKITKEQLKRLKYLEEQEKKRQECIDLLKCFIDISKDLGEWDIEIEETKNVSHDQ